MFKDVFRCSQLFTNVIGSCQIGAANCILFFSIWQTVQSADKLVVKEQILMNSEADTNLDLLFLRWMLLAQIPPSISKIWFSAFLKPFAHSSVFIVLSMLYQRNCCKTDFLKRLLLQKRLLENIIANFFILKQGSIFQESRFV